MELVWKALGDSTRREILDALRDGPRTTGALAERFAREQTRYGVMKHLKVLERANLISIRRDGRTRWNYLNAVPLRAIYERWLGPYQELWATNLLRLKQAVETDNNHERQTTMDYNAFDITQEITLEASRDQVWAALTRDITRWWAYRVGERGSTISFDPRLGGRFEERWGDGNGVCWGQVVGLDKGKTLRLHGSCGMTGAGTGDWTYELEDRGGSTLLRLTHHAYGYRDPETADSYTKGWQGLLDGHLRAWIDGGVECEAMYK